MKKKTPSGLKESGKKFYDQVLAQYVFDDGHNLERLLMAARCLDEIAESEAIIKKEGRYIFDRFRQRKEHPAGKVIRENKIVFCRIIRELGLDLTASGDSRPPGLY